MSDWKRHNCHQIYFMNYLNRKFTLIAYKCPYTLYNFSSVYHSTMHSALCSERIVSYFLLWYISNSVTYSEKVPSGVSLKKSIEHVTSMHYICMFLTFTSSLEKHSNSKITLKSHGVISYYASLHTNTNCASEMIGFKMSGCKWLLRSFYLLSRLSPEPFLYPKCLTVRVYTPRQYVYNP